MRTPIVEIENVVNYLGGELVHDGVSLTIAPKEIFAIMGGSGSGKTTLLRNVLMLLKPASGSVKVFGTNVVNCTESDAQNVRRRWGVMFQQGALFSGLSVLENIMFPLTEFAGLPRVLSKEIALLKLSLVGLSAQAAYKHPSELSGGMLKRAAAARAIALDPELLILDEPTAGLDPKSTKEFDELLLSLRESLGLSILLVSHDVDSLQRLCDRAAFLGQGKVLSVGSLEALKASKEPMIESYFSAYAQGQRRTHITPIVHHPLRGLR